VCVMGRGSKNVFRYRWWGQEVVVCEKVAAVIGVVLRSMGWETGVTSRSERVVFGEYVGSRPGYGRGERRWQCVYGRGYILKEV
jgi:hypothetical protein